MRGHQNCVSTTKDDTVRRGGHTGQPIFDGCEVGSDGCFARVERLEGAAAEARDGEAGGGGEGLLGGGDEGIDAEVVEGKRFAGEGAHGIDDKEGVWRGTC